MSTFLSVLHSNEITRAGMCSVIPQLSLSSCSTDEVLPLSHPQLNFISSAYDVSVAAAEPLTFCLGSVSDQIRRNAASVARRQSRKWVVCIAIISHPTTALLCLPLQAHVPLSLTGCSQERARVKKTAAGCYAIHCSPPCFLRVLHLPLPLCKYLITDFHLIRQQVLKCFLQKNSL